MRNLSFRTRLVFDYLRMTKNSDPMTCSSCEQIYRAGYRLQWKAQLLEGVICVFLTAAEKRDAGGGPGVWP